MNFRRLTVSDEAEAIAAHATMEKSDQFGFLLGYKPGEDWAGFISRLKANERGEELVEDWMIPSTFLVAEIDGKIAGRVSIRHSLNAFLASVGGHIGYCVLPSFRQRGVATEMLKHGITVAHKNGVNEILITCAEGNIGSRKVIESNGFTFEMFIDDEDLKTRYRRYWLNKH
jgi:predicted acetyltransferase